MLVKHTLNAETEEKLLEAARTKYKADEGQIMHDVKDIKEWIKKNPHLENIRQDDIFLRYFLHGCGYSLEKTKKRLDLFFSVKTTLPAWFDNWGTEERVVQEILSAGVFLPLPGYDKQGRAVFLVRYGAIKPATMRVDDIYKVTIMLLELALEGNTQAGVHGLAIINDVSGVTASHVAMMTSATMKKHIVVFQEAYPMENQTLIDSSVMHFLNMPKIVETVFNLLLSQSKEMYKKMNQVHPKGDNSLLLDNVGHQILPTEYGGENNNIQVSFILCRLLPASR